MLQIVPEDRISAKPDVGCRLRAAFREEVRRRVGSGDFAARENVALSLANELVCADLTGALEDLVESHGDGELMVDGERYRHHAEGCATYHSLAGPLRVRRPSFRKVGQHNGPTVIPIDKAAGIVERATPAFAQRVAMGKADGPSRDLHRQLAASHRVTPSRTTLEAMGQRIGSALSERRVHIEAVARRSEALPEGARTICLGLDRTSAPMEEDLPADTPRPQRKRPRVRKAPPPVTVKYRMAYIGTVSFADAEGEVLTTFKYGATRDDGPAAILHSMMRDVRRALAQDPELRVVVIQDAAKEMWTLLTTALRAEPSVDRWEELVDHYHAMGHLWNAADAMEGRTDATMAEWRASLRESDDAIDAIALQLEHETSRGFYRPKYRIAIEDELTFVTNNGARTRYASLRDAGFPIGSGPTEGACKSFFSVRCKRSGQRWRNPGLAATLACRTHLLNDRLPVAMRTLRRRDYTAVVKPVAKLAA